MILLIMIIVLIISISAILLDIIIKFNKFLYILFFFLLLWTLSLLLIIGLEKSNILVLDLHNNFILSIYSYGGLFIGIPLTIIIGIYIVIKNILKK